MVETPVRRSRRVRGQSDADKSAASAAPSHSSRASNASSATPTRRNTRAARAAARAADGEGLEAIPEAIEVDASGGDVDVATSRAKSAKKQKKEEPSATKSSKKKPKPGRKSSDADAGKSEGTETPKLSKNALKKQRRARAMSGDGEEAAADADKSKGDEASAPKSTDKKKKPKKRNPGDVEDKDAAPAAASPKSPKKKQGGKQQPSPKKSPASPGKKKPHAKTAVSPSPRRKSLEAKPKPVLDTKVHRLRFLKLHQNGILAMASTPLPSGSPSSLGSNPVRLAVSREGGSVELLSPQDRWVAVGEVPGVRGREVDALVWVCGGRANGGDAAAGASSSSLGSQGAHPERLADEQRHLFGCSRDGTIFELDFGTKRQKGVIGSGGGGVFCLASLCSRGKCCNGGSCGGYFAAGCEDGTVKIYSAFGSDGGKTASGMPELVATLPSAGTAVLSLAWVPGQSAKDDGGMGGSVIFAGVADGTIRRFDCATSVVTGPISTGSVLAPSRGSVSTSYRWKSTLRMTVENRGLREATKVWSLQALSDGTVISGDSLGHVQIWDGVSGTMTQTFDHNENDADVLCLAVTEDENKIFASGVDSSVRCYQRQGLSASGSKGQSDMLESTPVRRWISSNSHRKHSHDVKALAICHRLSPSNKLHELLVSGSVDTRICTHHVKDFQRARPKIWYNWPALSPVSVSRKERLVSVTRSNRIDLYRLSSPEMDDPRKNMNPEGRDETKCLVKTISIQSPFNLTCSVISNDGKFLAASDAVSLYLFSFEIEDEDGVFDVVPTRVHLSGECKHPATALRFDEKGRLICATNNGPINILRISPASDSDSDDGDTHSVTLGHSFKEHTVDWSSTSHQYPVVSLDLSEDGKWLAAGRCSLGKGAVHVFNLLEEDDGRYQHWWSLPKMDAPTTCVKFLGGESLAVGLTNNEFHIYNLGRRSLSHWSNDMGLPLRESLPRELTSRSEPVARIVSNPEAPERLILGSYGYFCVVHLDRPVPERASMFPPDHLRAKRLPSVRKDDTLLDFPPPKKKKKTTTPGGGSNFTLCLRYCEILFQDFIGENEMVIVEEPRLSILEELPDALSRRMYGT
ncbi:hypothetical protein ACHAXT_010367 [Thalassiosira profunda]